MKQLYIPVISFSLFLFFIAGCRELEQDKLDQDALDDQIIRQHIAEKELPAQKDPMGYYYVRLVENPGGMPVDEDQVVSVYYRISLLDGKVLESRQIVNSQPLKFMHTWGGLAPEAINYGISLMKTGEKYRFLIPSGLAFGEHYELGYFGSNEILSAEVELVKVESLTEHAAWEDDSIRKYIASHQIANCETLSSGVYKYTVNAGHGGQPVAGKVVQVVLRRKYLNETYAGDLVGAKSDTVDLYLPVGQNDYVEGISRATEGLKEGLLSMSLGEEAVILTPSHLAFGGKLIDYGDSYGGSIQVFPQKFRDKFVKDYLGMQQNIYPLIPLKYEAKLLRIY